MYFAGKLVYLIVRASNRLAEQEFMYFAGKLVYLIVLPSNQLAITIVEDDWTLLILEVTGEGHDGHHWQMCGCVGMLRFELLYLISTITPATPIMIGQSKISRRQI